MNAAISFLNHSSTPINWFSKFGPGSNSLFQHQPPYIPHCNQIPPLSCLIYLGGKCHGGRYQTWPSQGDFVDSLADPLRRSSSMKSLYCIPNCLSLSILFFTNRSAFFQCPVVWKVHLLACECQWCLVMLSYFHSFLIHYLDRFWVHHKFHLL